jgi:ubiquinone/menaquinone biosynthesis C-methylase UbiE
MKSTLEQLIPPILYNFLAPVRSVLRSYMLKNFEYKKAPENQELDVYWNPKLAELLENWGNDTVWNEIQFLMSNCSGKVLDIACGPGKPMELLSKFPGLDVYGCDISDLLISKAIERGISKDRLVVCDATNTKYESDFFDNAYSIGSLEHFTEDGIVEMLLECKRIVKGTSFHMIPVSRSGNNEGWITCFQSYHINSVAWWLEKYKSAYEYVEVLDSSWPGDSRTIGKWFVCKKNL